jgi:hypothetical protein
MTAENKYVEYISPIGNIVAESRHVAMVLLQELEQHQIENDDTVLAIHFTRASIYKLVSILMQLTLNASKEKAS